MLKQSLRSLFKSYGEVLDVVAHSNLRMRGQAFVSFANKDIAGKAAKEVKGFPLYGKPMVSSRFPSLYDSSIESSLLRALGCLGEGRGKAAGLARRKHERVELITFPSSFSSSANLLRQISL